MNKTEKLNLNKDRMMGIARSTYEGVGRAITPNEGDSDKDMLESIFGTQVGLMMAIEANLECIHKSELMSKAEHDRLQTQFATMRKDIIASITAGLGLIPDPSKLH